MHLADPVEGHTSKSVDQSLHALRLHAVEMGGLVIDQVSSAVTALLERDVRLAEVVLSREPLVNDYESRLDRDSLTFIALQQPVANDLRVARAIARAGLELMLRADRSPDAVGLLVTDSTVVATEPPQSVVMNSIVKSSTLDFARSTMRRTPS